MIEVGARNSLAVAVVAAGVGLLVGVPLGLAAAARGGLVDEVIMRTNDLVFAFRRFLLEDGVDGDLQVGADARHVCQHAGAVKRPQPQVVAGLHLFHGQDGCVG